MNSSENQNYVAQEIILLGDSINQALSIAHDSEPLTFTDYNQNWFNEIERYNNEENARLIHEEMYREEERLSMERELEIQRQINDQLEAVANSTPLIVDGRSFFL